MSGAWDVPAVRALFPLLTRTVHGKPLVYLDNAATTAKVLPALEAMDFYLRQGTANIHRGVHFLSQEASASYEKARAEVAAFLGAADAREIVFTSGSTDALNLVAGSWGRANLGPGDAILLTETEHHANIVPWQLLQKEKGFEIRVLPVGDDAAPDLSKLDALIDARLKLAAFVWVSNATGAVLPAADIIRAVRAGSAARVLIDASQAAAHLPIDVKKIDADVLVFSGHKVFGPTGIGALWAKTELLTAMPPWKGGGDMIKSVSFAGTTFNDPPHRFEAGTPPVAEAIGLGAACRWLAAQDRAAVARHEAALLRRAEERVAGIPGFRRYGPSLEARASILTFNVDGLHASDLGTLIDLQGVALRTGRHCTDPLWARLGVTATARASFSLYTSLDEVDLFADALRKTLRTAGLPA